MCCRYSLEVPQWGASKEYPQHMFLWRNNKIYQHFFFGWNNALSGDVECISLEHRLWWENADAHYITKTRLFKYVENFTTKNWKFSDKNSNIFHISAQNIDCRYSLELPHWGGSNKYPQSMFLSRNKKNNVYPCKPQFYCIKVGFKGVSIIKACFRDEGKNPCILRNCSDTFSRSSNRGFNFQMFCSR